MDDVRCKKQTEPILYYDDLNPASRAALMVVELLDAPIELCWVNTLEGEHLSRVYKSINPNCILPTLTHKNQTVSGCGLLLYICRNFSDGCANQLLCENSYEKQMYVTNRMCYEFNVIQQVHDDLMTDLVVKTYAKTDLQCHRRRIACVYSQLESFLHGSKFMAGNRITVADIAIVSTVAALDLIFPLVDEQEPWPNLYNWFKRMHTLAEYRVVCAGLQKQRRVVESYGKFCFPPPLQSNKRSNLTRSSSMHCHNEEKVNVLLDPQSLKSKSEMNMACYNKLINQPETSNNNTTLTMSQKCLALVDFITKKLEIDFSTITGEAGKPGWDNVEQQKKPCIATKTYNCSSAQTKNSNDDTPRKFELPKEGSKVSRKEKLKEQILQNLSECLPNRSSLKNTQDPRISAGLRDFKPRNSRNKCVTLKEENPPDRSKGPSCRCCCKNTQDPKRLKRVASDSSVFSVDEVETKSTLFTRPPSHDKSVDQFSVAQNGRWTEERKSSKLSDIDAHLSSDKENTSATKRDKCIQSNLKSSITPQGSKVQRTSEFGSKSAQSSISPSLITQMLKEIKKENEICKPAISEDLPKKLAISKLNSVVSSEKSFKEPNTKQYERISRGDTLKKMEARKKESKMISSTPSSMSEMQIFSSVSGTSTMEHFNKLQELLERLRQDLLKGKRKKSKACTCSERFKNNNRIMQQELLDDPLQLRSISGQLMSDACTQYQRKIENATEPGTSRSLYKENLCGDDIKKSYEVHRRGKRKCLPGFESSASNIIIEDLFKTLKDKAENGTHTADLSLNGSDKTHSAERIEVHCQQHNQNFSLLERMDEQNDTKGKTKNSGKGFCEDGSNSVKAFVAAYERQFSKYESGINRTSEKSSNFDILHLLPNGKWVDECGNTVAETAPPSQESFNWQILHLLPNEHWVDEKGNIQNEVGTSTADGNRQSNLTSNSFKALLKRSPSCHNMPK